MEKVNRVGHVLVIACLLLAMVAGEGLAQSRDTHPTEAGNVLDAIPNPGSVIPYGVPQGWFDFKDDVYDKIGLRFGFSYQMLGQSASDVLPNATHDTALGDWWGFLTKWTLLDRGGDNEGTFVFSMFDRGAVGNNAVPANFGLVDIGSLTTNVEFTHWSFAIENLYWEQWLSPGRNKLMFRVGNQVVTTFLNPFRFKDARVSFTTGPWAFHPSVPYPTFGFGAAFKWWPDEDSGLYVAGSLNDMNGDPNLQGFDWSTVGRGEFFYGLEVGFNQKRSKDDYDHVHLLVFYADERSTRSPETLPNKAGGGFRLLGEKQWNRWVGFASYTYNTAEGGGVTGTFSEHVVTAGGAFLDPLNIEGEAALSFLYMNPIDEIFAGPVRNQYGLETYWRIQFTPHIWITPGLHLIFDPALNLEYDFIAIPQVKFRIAL
jgi:carbohydrate-selective porin OprB